MPPIYPDSYPSLILRLGDLELAITRITEGGYGRTRQQGAEVDYSYSGTPIIKGHSHKAKYIWTVTALLDYQEQKLLKAIAEQSDYLMQSPPYDSYEVVLSDLVATVTEPTQTRGLASYFLDDETLGCCSYFAQFNVVLPLQSIEEVNAGYWFQVTFQLIETTLNEEDAPSGQLEPPTGGNPPTSGGYNVPILLGQLPSQVVTTNNIGTTINWSNLSGKPSSFPSTWADVSGKPSTFPSTWADVSGKPDLAYQTELDTVTNNLLGVIGTVNDNFANYLPKSGGTLTGALSIASITNGLGIVNWNAFRLGNDGINTNNYLGISQTSSIDLAISPYVRRPVVFSHHTGISLSSFSGYGGTRIYSANPIDPFNYDGNLLAQFNYPRNYFGVPLSIGGGTPNAFSFEVNGDTYAMGYTRISNNGIYAQSMDAYIVPVGMTYGSWVIRGSGGGAGGWNGLCFPTGIDQAVDLSLMMGNVIHGAGGCQVGVYDTSLGWYFYTIGQTMYAGAYANISDGDLKEEVQPMLSGLDAIKALTPVSFKWKKGKGDSDRHNGFIAQQLESSTKLKHLVRRSSQGIGKDGKPTDEKLSIVFSELIPYLVKAIQELDEALDQMGARVKGRIDTTNENAVSQAQNIAQMSSQMATLQTSINTQNATNQASLNGISAQVANLGSQLAALAANVSSVQALAQTNSQRIDGITKGGGK